MNVPLLDLGLQTAPIRHDIDAAIQRVLDSGQFVLGPEVAALETEMAEFLGCTRTLGVSSGTDALLLALMALDVGPGAEVIVPTFSFFATAGVVARLGARPIFVDIDPVTYNIDASSIEAHINDRTAAIIPVHLFGQSADMAAIMEIGRKHGVPVIEDAAQAIGASAADGQMLGAVGDIGCFSFFPTKNLGAFGDAGLVSTSNPELAEKMQLLRVHGAAAEYRHDLVGGNFRIDAIQAAILRTKLGHLAGWSRGRRENADRYRALFVDRGLANTGTHLPTEELPVALPSERAENVEGSGFPHIYNQFVLRVDRRDELVARLRAENIGCSIYYPVPFHKQPCFAPYIDEGLSLPVSERAATEVVALPIFGELQVEQIEHVVDVIATFYEAATDVS